jgi:hypothetical protein
MKKFHLPKQILIGLGIIFLGASFVATSGVLAKFANTVKNESSPVTAKTFYFESNYLTEDNHTYKLNSGTASVSFDLYNYENALRFSEVDSTYTIVVTSADDSFTIDGESITQKTISADGGTKIDRTVTLGNLKNGQTYKVTVTADGGYVKTLSATFEVAPSREGFFMDVDNSNEHYVILTVWTENVSGEITVNVPAGLIPDVTDLILADVENYSDGAYESFSFTDSNSFSETFASRSYRFFKTDKYESNTFTAQIGDISANLITN